MALRVAFFVFAFIAFVSGVTENAELPDQLSSIVNELTALGGQSARIGGELADIVKALRGDAILNTTPVDELAGFTAEKVENVLPMNSTHDQLSRQVAECRSGMLVGEEVQSSFLDDPMDPRVRCPSGELVPAVLLNPARDGSCSSTSCSARPPSWNLCRSLCPSQTCAAMHNKGVESTLQDDCLMGNVLKTFRAISRTPPSEPTATVLWVRQNVCLNRDRGYTFPTHVQRGLQDMVQSFDPLSSSAAKAASFAMNRPATFDVPERSAGGRQGHEPSGAPRHVIVDESGSMGRVAEALKMRLREEFSDAESISSFDGSLTEKGSMGGKLVKTVSEAPRGSTVILVSDFRDGEADSLVEQAREIALDRQIVLALESVEHYPQTHISEAARATGGTVNVGNFGQK